MPHRYIYSNLLLPIVNIRPFSALREKWKEGYTFNDFRSDLMAGIIVGMVAIPLGMALAIASGVPPQSGLYTVILGGAIIAAMGGSRYQVSGPTAAFVVILAPIAQKFGFAGLLVAGLMAGIMLVAMGLARMGRLIEFIPHPVTTGFTAGIAVVIGTIQLKDFLGLKVAHMPESYLGRVGALFRALPSASFTEFAIGALTLALLLLWPRVNKKIPAPLVALGTVAVLTAILQRVFPQLEIATIGNRFTSVIDGKLVHGIPQSLPSFTMPWNFPGVNGARFNLNFEMIEALIPSAFAIAILGAIESLLAAVVADGMAQTRHNPDAELVALGTGNIVCPFFGGIAATGAIARTATNIRSGAKSPIAAVIHSLFTLLVILAFAPYVAYLPMSALAALLLLVAYNMSEVKHFFHILKVAPKSDVIVLVMCFGLTVVFDMVIGVTVGVVMAALLFMQRMATITTGQVLPSANHPALNEPLPQEIMLYEIGGPLFFGAADKAMTAISGITDHIQTVILNLENVPVIDVTGLVALESAVNKLLAHDRLVVIVGLRAQPKALLTKEGLLTKSQQIKSFANLKEAVEFAKEHQKNRKPQGALVPAQA